MDYLGLEDVVTTKLKIIDLPDGNVFRFLKNSDVGFIGFGEAYFSTIKYNSVKAWKRHLIMTMNLVVISGKVRFVFCDDLKKDAFKVIDLCIENYFRLTVPPGVWFGFQGLSEVESIILNIGDIEHSSNETERKTIDEFEYKWNKF